MDWIFSHLQIVVFVAIAAASVLQKLKRTNAQQQAREVMETDRSEQTRRVQEEIRRKIAARTGRVPARGAQPTQPPVMMSDESPEQRAGVFEELTRQMAEAKKFAEARTRAAYEQQAQQQIAAE